MNLCWRIQHICCFLRFRMIHSFLITESSSTFKKIHFYFTASTETSVSCLPCSRSHSLGPARSHISAILTSHCSYFKDTCQYFVCDQIWYTSQAHLHTHTHTQLLRSRTGKETWGKLATVEWNSKCRTLANTAIKSFFTDWTWTCVCFAVPLFWLSDAAWHYIFQDAILTGLCVSL